MKLKIFHSLLNFRAMNKVQVYSFFEGQSGRDQFQLGNYLIANPKMEIEIEIKKY